ADGGEGFRKVAAVGGQEEVGRGGGAVAHQIGRLAAGGELEAYRVDDHVARPHAVAQGASLGEGVPVGRLAVDLGLVGPGAGAGVAGDHAVAVGRVELAVGHDHHGLERPGGV